MSAATARKSSAPLNVLTTAAGVGAVLLCLLAIDARVRDGVVGLVTGRGANAELGGATAQTRHLIETVASVLRDQSLAYAPLTVFGAVALVLVLFMMRT